MREYLRTYVPVWRSLRTHAIRWYKASHGCLDCGIRDPLVLEFDHVNDDKEFNIGTDGTKTVSMSKILLEMQKCEVVCANCHRIRTHTRRGNVKPPVWTRRRYNSRAK